MDKYGDEEQWINDNYTREEEQQDYSGEEHQDYSNEEQHRSQHHSNEELTRPTRMTSCMAGKWLSDIHIQASQVLMKKEFEVGGLQNPLPKGKTFF